MGTERVAGARGVGMEDVALTGDRRVRAGWERSAWRGRARARDRSATLPKAGKTRAGHPCGNGAAAIDCERLGQPTSGAARRTQS